MKLAAVVLVAGCWTGAVPATPVPPTPLRVDTPQPAGFAKVIQRSASGGVIELDGARPTAMDDATQAMAEHCGPGNFTITQEGEEAIGSETTDGHVKTATAWRVHYQCSGG